MSRLILPILLLAGCEAGSAPERPSDRIACALAGAAEFQPLCTVERIAGPDGLELLLRSPSGGFRRLLVTRDGRGVVAADGAEPARVKVIGPGAIEVSIGEDRYRLPATVK